MLYANCQVCGNQMFSESYWGTDADGMLNPDFCSNCYKNGKFYNRDWDGSLSSAISPWSMSFTNNSPFFGRNII